MKIILLCSLSGDFDLSQPCRREDFMALQEAYRQAELKSCVTGPSAPASYRYYCSPLPAARQSLLQEFGDVAVEEFAEALSEPFLPLPESVKEGDPFEKWLKKAALTFGKSRKEYSEEQARTEAILSRLEQAGEDCVLISHPIRIRLILSLLRRRGYLIEKPRLLGLRPLDRIRASLKTLHCGGCQHNCLLSEAKCHLGQDKERRQKNKHR